VGRDEGRLSLRLGLGRVVPRERSNPPQNPEMFDAHSFPGVYARRGRSPGVGV